MLKIIEFPNEVLRTRAPEFDFNNPSMDPVELEKTLITEMFNNAGIGLAANQLGISARVFVMGYRSTPDAAQAFFNPMVVDVLEDSKETTEGCLSFPGIFVNIKRPKRILARWQTANGEWKESELGGYDCTCFLHELDHLEGIVFQDRVSKLKWSMAVKATKKRKN